MLCKFYLWAAAAAANAIDAASDDAVSDDAVLDWGGGRAFFDDDRAADAADDCLGLGLGLALAAGFV